LTAGAAFYALRTNTNIRQIGEEKNLRGIWNSMLFYHEQNLRRTSSQSKMFVEFYEWSDHS